MRFPSSLLSLDHDYDRALQFVNAHPTIEYGSFDRYVQDELTLFDVPQNDALEEMKETVDNIIAILPAIKRIFVKPIMHLKDVYELIPTDAVQHVDNYTLAHAAIHSELYSYVDENGIMPKKLMSLEKIENYAIYENRIVTRTVDLILQFTKSSLALLREVLYSCGELHFNLLDHTHHALYFLAIGKLHRGYAVARSAKNALLLECAQKLAHIDRALRSQLSRPVYRACKSVDKRLALKKTNTFTSHKDYRKIYRFLVHLKSNTVATQKEAVAPCAYHAYGTLLTLFAAAHFHFSAPSASQICLQDPNVQLQFLDWTFEIKAVRSNNILALQYVFKKEQTYRICIVWNDRQSIAPQELEAFRQEVGADEYVFANAHGGDAEDSVRISLYDIDSFRRLQQLMLQGMIYADTARERCPFCGNALTRQDNGFECAACNARIAEKICENTGERYVISDIARPHKTLRNAKSAAERASFLHDRIHEARLHFRNITPIGPGGELLCPRCGKVHS